MFGITKSSDKMAKASSIRDTIGVARGGAQGAPPIKIPLTTKSYDNIAWRCLVAVFFQ